SRFTRGNTDLVSNRSTSARNANRLPQGPSQSSAPPKLAGQRRDRVSGTHNPTSPQPHHESGPGPDPTPHPRPGYEVHPSLRRRVPSGGHAGDPHARSSTPGERLRRAVRAHRPPRVPRLDADPRPPAPPDSARRLRRALQPAPTPPKPRSRTTRTRTSSSAQARPRDPPTTPRWTYQRIRPSRRVTE